MNYNSKTNTWSSEVKPETIETKNRAKELKAQGMNVKSIADELCLTPTRIYQMLRG